MTATLTIRGIDEVVKRKLRIQAAKHQRSMEAEVRAILARAVEEGAPVAGAAATPLSGGPFDRLRGIWKGRASTDQVLQITRGE
jgi:plasmid stability protein